MLTQSKSKKPEVAISKGDTPKDCLLKGIDNLGGISKFIDHGDRFSLNSIYVFPEDFL